MRNLKKILALALALVMTLSLMTVANAFNDDKDIDATYNEAVQVLTGLKVFKGVNDGSNFAPKQTITRAEVAAIIYRIVTGDVNDVQAGIYKDYAKFKDVAQNHWAAGYIGYCSNAELIVGDGTNFYPDQTVNGYQALAMILRAIGYDQNDEFKGNGWEIRVASTAQQKGILKNVNSGTLGTGASRELVAEILFQAIANTNTVTYLTNTMSYLDNRTTLGYNTFKLVGTVRDQDKWGRPATVWKLDKDNDRIAELTDTTLVTLEDAPDAVYTTAVTECDIADDLGLNDNEVYTLYTNGIVNDSQYVVQPLDTVQKIGGQGTLVEVYGRDYIVVIDTYLAQVTDVKDATYDAAGHLRTPSMITLNVYATGETSTMAQKATKMVLTNGTTNYTYAVGSMVLVNSYTKNNVNNTTGAVTVTDVATTNANVANVYGYQNLPVADYAEILGTAQSMTGAQTFLWYNSLQHTVNGTNYNDAARFYLDEAQAETVNHTWFFDQYGNLIGATNIATQYTYGVVENIQWQNPSMATGYAQATIRYMDGTTATLVVTSIDGVRLTYTTTGTTPNFGNGTISTSLTENANQCGNDLYRIDTAADGTVALEHVFVDADNNGHSYAINGTTVTKTTAEWSHMTKATIKGNNATTALSAITGTNTSNQSAVIYTNSNTTFLVRIGNTYTVVKGYENMASYTGTATVDWVNLDGDSYADYVYVIGTPDSATYFGMFYLTSNNAQAVLNAAGGIDYYVLTGIVDGVPGTIKLDGAATLNDSGTNYAISGLTEAALEAKLSSYVNMMFTVSHVNDEVVAMWGPKADISDLSTETKNNPAYTNLALDYNAATATAGTVTYDGQVLKVGNNYYNVVGLTPVVGSWTAPMDLSNMNVYVVYDKTTIAGTNTYVAKAVYIASPAETGGDSGVTPTTDDTIGLVNTGTTYTATMFKGTTTAINGSTTVVLQRRPAGSSDSWQNATVLNWTTGDGTAATPYTYTGTYTNGGVSAGYEMRVVAVNGYNTASQTIIATSNSFVVYS